MDDGTNNTPSYLETFHANFNAISDNLDQTAMYQQDRVYLANLNRKPLRFGRDSTEKQEIFFCPLCGQPLKMGDIYFVCDKHGNFDVAIDHGCLIVRVVRG